MFSLLRHEPQPEPTVWDYTNRYWGHNLHFYPEGQHDQMCGFGGNPQKGDILKIGTRQWRIKSIRWERDPHDMWWVQVEELPKDQHGH